MRKVFFFIFLFTLLLRGVDEVYAGKLLHTTCFLADQEFRRTQKGKEDYSFVQTVYDNSSHCDIICEEPQDDGHQDFAKKYKLLTGYYSIHTPTFYYYHLYGCLKDRLPDEKSLACKYITQRALRI